MNFFYSFSCSHPFGQFHGSRALGGTIAGSCKSQYFWFCAERHKFVNVQTVLAHYPQLSIHGAGQKDRNSGNKNVPFPLFFLTNVTFHGLGFFFISFKLVSKGYNIRAWAAGFPTAIRNTVSVPTFWYMKCDTLTKQKHAHGWKQKIHPHYFELRYNLHNHAGLHLSSPSMFCVYILRSNPLSWSIFIK